MVQQVDWFASSRKELRAATGAARMEQRLTQDLRFAGYNPLINAESVFRSIVHRAVMYYIIYVGDILVLTEFRKAMLSVKKLLSKMYTVKNPDEAEYFLGVKIERESSTVKLTQTSYVKNVLDRFEMLECKTAHTPKSDPVSVMIKQPRPEADSKPDERRPVP
jgi:Reverse transcriptase (RNA-dependent DNA polymerase)